MTRANLVTLLLGPALILGGASLAQKANVPDVPDKLALAKDNAKEMLLLMDTNKDGKVSRQEWMDFMSAKFDRLDIHKTGQLNPKELLRT